MTAAARMARPVKRHLGSQAIKLVTLLLEVKRVGAAKDKGHATYVFPNTAAACRWIISQKASWESRPLIHRS
jgi:hypothetical protein